MHKIRWMMMERNIGKWVAKTSKLCVKSNSAKWIRSTENEDIVISCFFNRIGSKLTVTCTVYTQLRPFKWSILSIHDNHHLPHEQIAKITIGLMLQRSLEMPVFIGLARFASIPHMAGDMDIVDGECYFKTGHIHMRTQAWKEIHDIDGSKTQSQSHV